MQESHVAILHHLSHILFMDESVFHDLKVLWETLCNPMQKRLEINARLLVKSTSGKVREKIRHAEWPGECNKQPLCGS